ncbi:MAG: response regulator [Chloroflexi bacterium]|nr:response regulator [Chloroflexota bacterium]MCC6895183.1 response regulator [Anaerolineae bacterium]
MSRILVIEDEPNLRKNILDFLELEGFDVFEAEDGLVGLECAREQHPDLIISDISMPNMDGYKALLELRKDERSANIPVIFLSAMADRSFVRHGMELGADDYLTKPFSYPELLAAIQARLDRHVATQHSASKELESVKKRLARVVSHEMRTPVASILMVQNLLSAQLDSLETHEIRDILDSLQMGSYRIYHLAEQLALMTQLDTNTLSQDVVSEYGFATPIWTVLMAAVNLSRRFAYRNPSGGIQVDDRDKASLVLCNAPSLTHALAEIMANGLDYSQAGRDVTVAQWARDSWIYISITDCGPGMTEAQVEQATRDFEQIDRDRNEQQGLGLGLHLAHRIIEAHFGHLEIISRPGSGTQINISLPLHEND